MAQNVNVVAITGNLTKDPELRTTAGGTSVATLRVAVNERRKNASGEWVDRGNFFNVVVWGNQAENCAQYLSRGRPVAVQGRLTWREWETDGHKREAVEITADRVQFLSTGEGRSGQQTMSDPADLGYDPHADPADTGVGDGGGGSDMGFAPPDDDIPF